MVEMRKNMGMGQFPGNLNKVSVRPMMGQMRPPMKPQMQAQVRAMPNQAQMPTRPQMRQIPNPQKMRQMPVQIRPPMKPQPAQSNGVMEEDADLKVWYDDVSRCLNGYNMTASRLMASPVIANNPSEREDLGKWRSNLEKCAEKYNLARNQVINRFGQNSIKTPAINTQNVRRF